MVAFLAAVVPFVNAFGMKRKADFKYCLSDLQKVTPFFGSRSRAPWGSKFAMPMITLA